MAAFGPEIADAYIEVHADTAKFRRELRQRLVKDMQGFAKKAQKTFGDYLNMDKAADWDSFHRNLARAVRTGDFSRLRKEFADTGDWVGEVTKRVHALRDAVITMQNAEGEIETKPIFSEKDIDRIRKSLGLYVQELEQAGGRDVRRFYTKLADRYEEDYKKFSDTQRRKRLQVEKFYTDLANRYEADFERLRESHRRQEITTAEFYRRLGNRYEADATKFAAEQERKQETFDRMNRLHATALRERTKAEQDAAAEVILARQRILDQLTFEAKAERFDTVELQRLRKEIAAELAAATEDQRRELGVRESDWDRHVARLRSTLLTFRDVELRVTRRNEREAAAAMSRQNRQYSVFFDKMKNSRSEFIHAIAVAMDAISTIIGRTGDLFVDTVRKINDEGLGSVFRDMGTSLKGLGQNWQAILVTIGAILSSLAAMGALSGTLISLASGLAAILVGIVSSLGMAILALVPMAGMLLGAAYGAGLLVAAFKDMDKYLPGVSEALDELKRVFSDVDVPAFAKGVAGPLKGLFTDLAKSLEGDRVAGALGKAFGSIVTSMSDLVKSPGWTSFMTALETTIPRALAAFGAGFGAVIEGLMSAFAAGGPGVEALGNAFARFGENFAKTMDEMDKSGRLDEFFDLAADSLIVVSDLIWSVGKALVGLFEAAGPAGNDLLRSITGLVDKFTVWVTSAEGRNQVAEWMEFGREVAEKLWDIIAQVGTELKRLDTPQNRKWALSLLNAIRGIIHGVGNFIEFAGKLATAWETAYTSVVDFIQGIGKWFGDSLQSARDWASGAEEAIEGFVSSVGEWFGDVGAWFGDVWQNIKDWWAGLDWTEIAQSIYEGFDKGLRETWTNFSEGVKEIWSSFLDVVKDVLGIASPSTVFAGYGADVVAGFRQGINDAWTAFTTWISGLFTSLKDTAKKAWETLQKDTSAAWEKVTKAVSDKAEAIRSTLSKKWEEARKVVGTAIDTIRTNVSTKWTEIKTAVTTKVEEIRAALVSKWESIRSNASSKWAEVKASIASAWEGIKSGVSTKIGEVVSLVGGLPTKAVGALKNVGTALYWSGKNLIEGFLSGIRVKVESVVTAAREMASRVVRTVQKHLGIKSPSKVFERLGIFTAQGFERGINKQQAAVQSALVKMVAPPNLNVPGFSGNITGASAYTNARTLNVAPGAVQIQTRTTDPRLAAGMVLDGLASKMMGV